MKTVDIYSFIEFLDDFDNYSTNKSIKYLGETITNEGFNKMMFDPSMEPEKLKPLTEKMYSLLMRKKIFKALIAAVNDNIEDCDRSTATWLYTVVNMAIESSAARETRLKTNLHNGAFSKSDGKTEALKIEEFNSLIAKLFKLVKLIVKKKSKKLSSDSNLPKNICKTALYKIPDTKYINNFKIGYYLNIILSDIYMEAENTNDFKANNIKWKSFFKNLFGQDNVLETATFILLEGVNRIDKYKSNNVKEVWDSLTKFALSELEGAPTQLKDQMMALYTKRVTKMFANNTYDLRANLLTLDEHKYPELVTVISKYSDKLKSIINREK